MTKGYTANPEAYQDYLKGSYWWNKQTEEGLHKSIEYFQQAIASDPNYALAYAGLADSYGSLGGYGMVSPKEAYPKAKEAALKALAIDETLAEAHTALAWVTTFYDGDFSGGESEFHRAIQMNPSYALAHRRYGLALAYVGRLGEGLSEEKHAVELDPLSVGANWSLGYQFYIARQYHEAIQQEQKTLELDPDFVQAHHTLRLAYVKQSAYKEASAEFEKTLLIYPDYAHSLSALGYAYGAADRPAEAQKSLAKLSGLSKHRFIPAVDTALIYVDLGEKDKAFEWLEKAFEERWTIVIAVDPAFDPCARTRASKTCSGG